MSTQSQAHGFIFENEIREIVFDLRCEKNNTDIHDIPKEKNKLNKNENISIKVTGSKTLCCADIIRFYKYLEDKNSKHTIIIIKYKQTNNSKIIECIYEIDYNEKCHKLLFGNLPLEELKKFCDGVKSIPKNVSGHKAKEIFDYLNEKKKLETKYNLKIQINPKVDSSQSRVQCSIPNFEILLKDFIIYKSSIEIPNMIRGKEISSSINSPARSRNGITKKKLIKLCKENGIKNYSKLNKLGIEELLTKNNINYK